MKCNWCGRFISFKDKDAMTYTNYGGFFDSEPPEPTDICGKCWNKLSEKQKQCYKNSDNVWRLATKLFKEIKEASLRAN